MFVTSGLQTYQLPRVPSIVCDEFLHRRRRFLTISSSLPRAILSTLFSHFLFSLLPPIVAVLSTYWTIFYFLLLYSSRTPQIPFVDTAAMLLQTPFLIVGAAPMFHIFTIFLALFGQLLCPRRRNIVAMLVLTLTRALSLSLSLSCISSFKRFSARFPPHQVYAKAWWLSPVACNISFSTLSACLAPFYSQQSVPWHHIVYRYCCLAALGQTPSLN